MGAPRLPPDFSPRNGPSRRAGLAASLSALTTTLPAFSDPLEAAEAGDAVRRIAQRLLNGGMLEGRPDLLGVADAVLTADPARLPEVVTRLVTLLGRSMQGDAERSPDTLLVIEDDARFAHAVAEALSGPGRRVLTAATAAAAREVLRQETVALIVLDLILPDSDGRNMLLEFRSDPRTSATPVFVVSARFGARTRAECSALGADAYFEKPLDLDAFSAAVGARLERHAEHAWQARRDPVTGLPNRAAFLESWTRLRQSAPEGTPFALAVLDLDHFSWLEDTWGSQFGDTVLRRAGVRLSMALRQAAVFARWDGAEFIALFAGHGADQAAQMIENALTVLRRVEFRPGDAVPLMVTFSAGVVDVPAGQSTDEAMAAADRLRYVAKASGRNRVAAGNPDTAVPIRRVLVAEDDPNVVRLLTRHLRREGFDVVVFGDGAEALAKAAESGPALVISDIEMPNLDGLGLLQGLRAHPELRHVPIMMLTAMGDESYIVRAFELGADDYVLKPFSIREVTARMRRLLRRPSLLGVPTAS